MTTTEKRSLPKAMAFFHPDGLMPAWWLAQQFADRRGRLATMPDIVRARLASKPGDPAWEMYYTTLTAEYLGLSKAGNRILIVAHGVGPMSNLNGICAAYKWQYGDKDRNRRGGRISREEFLELEAGEYGDVAVVDLHKYCGRYDYPFIQILRSSEAMTDPVLKARLGPDAEKYIIAHTEHARTWHREQACLDPENRYNLPDHDEHLRQRRHLHVDLGEPFSDPFILKVDDPSNCPYPDHLIEDGFAFAHLVSTGSLCHMHHEGYESLTLNVGCHEWANGVRFIGIKHDADLAKGVHSGPNIHELIRRHWRDLLIPSEETGSIGLRGLMQVEGQWFTQYPKMGAGLDTHESDYVVNSLEKLGDVIQFRTTIGGYHGFFKFDVKELESIAPPGANAYHFVSEPEIERHGGNPTHHRCAVQFYKADIDTSKRMTPRKQLSYDYNTMMALMEKECAV